MRLFENVYRLKVGDDIGDPATLSTRFSSIDLRLDALENVSASWNDAAQALINLGLQRINAELTPAFEAVQSMTDIGLLLIAKSHVAVTAGAGDIHFFVDPTDRHRYAPPAYVAAMPEDGSPAPAMLGRVVSFDRISGELVVNVDRVSGSGTIDAWVISPCSPTDTAEAAAEALASQNAAAASAAASAASASLASSAATLAS